MKNINKNEPEPKDTKWWLWLIGLVVLTLIAIIVLKNAEARPAQTYLYKEPVQWQDVESYTGTHKIATLKPLPQKLGGNTASINLKITPNPEHKVTLKDWYIKQAHKKTSKINVISSRECRKQFGRYNTC